MTAPRSDVAITVELPAAVHGVVLDGLRAYNRQHAAPPDFEPLALSAREEEGCESVYLDTFEFQARRFYEREGYTVFGVQEDYPPGSRRYFMRKALHPSSGHATGEAGG